MFNDDGGDIPRLSNNKVPHDEGDNMLNNDLAESTVNPRNPRPSFLSDGLDNSLNNMDGSEDRSVSVMNGEEKTNINSSVKSRQGDQPKKLAAQETKAVNCIKIILLIVLLLASCGFAVVVYKFTRNEETDTFEETFVVYAQQIEFAVQISAQNRLEAVGALAIQIQVYAHDSNLTWPFVTVSFFEDRVYSMKTLTDAFGILLFPIVSHKDRPAWEEYSVANRQWVNESYASQRITVGTTDEAYLTANDTWFDALWGDDYKNYRNPDFSSGIGGSIFGTWDPDNETIRGPFIYPDREVYFPQWQVAPMSWYSQSAINQNYAQFGDFENATKISLETGHAVLGIAWTDSEAPGFITTMIYPIYREVYAEKDEHNGSLDIVAFLGADIDWKDYLSGIFQDDAAGATVVIENSLDQVFTYKIAGASVTFVGENDTHDTKYDYLEESFIFGGHLASETIVKNSSYNGALLHPDWVQYTIRIYPSQDLEDTFYTAQPVVYTVVVLLVALVASGTFFLYDFLVERRQKVVLRTAERSDAIVSSLFPNKVKEQLYQTTPATDSNRGNKSSKHPSSTKEESIVNKGHLSTCDMSEQQKSSRSLLSKGDKMIESAVAGLHRTGNQTLEGPPIAELYEEATVFFADMVGFTAWSSQRSPADVFILLETCYGAFDVIADRRGVFKVETIGDCYVAVSGIPVRRDDHAIIMAKFARDILNTMSQQLGTLVPILGSSTASLAMRVGIHSGPVTAGVLRGDRARFQLFGDTVNTAARMESTSLRNRIQLSQATADLLINAGKAAWIAKRSDEVEAKGKGRMQTFWLKCSPPLPVANPATVTTQ